MALIKEYTTEFGVLPNAYHKIAMIYGDKNSIQFRVDVWRDSTTTGSPIATAFHGSFTPSMNGDNFIKQAYTYLKSTDDYGESEDV